MHYKRKLRHGDPNVVAVYKSETGICRHPNCLRPLGHNHGLGFCKTHYTKHLEATNTIKCKVDGCTKGVVFSGFCQSHGAYDWTKRQLAYLKRMRNAALGDAIKNEDTLRALTEIVKERLKTNP